MKIQLAKKEQLNTISKMLADMWTSGDVKEAKEWIKPKLKEKEVYVAMQGNEIAGIMSYERDFTHYANFCSDVYVSPEHRRKGIALKLLEKYVSVSAKEQPKKQRLVLSSTDVTNKASINLHMKAGFEKIGLIKGLHFGTDEVMFGYKLK